MGVEQGIPKRLLPGEHLSSNPLLMSLTNLIRLTNSCSEEALMAITKTTITEGRTPARAGGRIRVRSIAAQTRAGNRRTSDVTEVTVATKLFRMLRKHKDSVRGVLSSYAEAASEADRLGQPIDITITVRPNKAAPGITVEPAKGDALDRALREGRARGTARVGEILKSPDMVTAREFGALIGASHETVNQKRRSGEILALEGATRGLRYPTWQVTEDGRPLPGLADLFRILGGEPWTVYRFLLQRHGELDGETGLDTLKRNRVEKALAAARNVSEGIFA